ncbi:MAG TPA: hypothetical protein DHV55_13260 [Clostridiaceae bacterium]|nr:hypothetical protein [Clostridiaceae bacterium]
MGAKSSLWELNQKSISSIFGIDFKDDAFSIEDVAKKDFLLKLGLKQGIIYNYDSVLTADIEDLDICLNNMIEGRFFNEKREIRIFNGEDGIKGSIFDEKDEHTEGEYILYNRNNDKHYAARLKVKQYIDYDDEDNQAYIYYTKPCKLIYGGENR